MSNTEGNISPDISRLKGQLPWSEWEKVQDNSYDLCCQKDPQNGQNYNMRCYIVSKILMRKYEARLGSCIMIIYDISRTTITNTVWFLRTTNG